MFFVHEMCLCASKSNAFDEHAVNPKTKQQSVGNSIICHNNSVQNFNQMRDEMLRSLSLNWHNIIFDLKIKSEHFIHTANIRHWHTRFLHGRQYSMRQQPTSSDSTAFCRCWVDEKGRLYSIILFAYKCVRPVIWSTSTFDARKSTSRFTDERERSSVLGMLSMLGTIRNSLSQKNFLI